MTATGTDRRPPKVPRPEPAPVVDSPAVGELGAALAASDDPSAVLRRFLAAHPRTPLFEHGDGEEERIVTFLWSDAQAEEVLLFVNRVTDERDLDASLMRRLPGTPLWHLSYRMQLDWRASYSFVTRAPGQPWPWKAGDQVRIRHGLDRGLADPSNPDRMRNRAGTVMSVVSLDQAPPQPWLAPRTPPAAQGSVAELIAPDGRAVWAYRSAGLAEDASAPLLVVLDGDAWIGPRGGRGEGQDLPTTLDNLAADAETPGVVALFVDSVSREHRWDDLDERGGQSAWIADRLLPWAKLHFPVSSRPEDTVVIGQSLGAYTALRAAFEHPEAVGRVLAQSPSLWQRRLVPPRASAAAALRVHLEVGAQEWVLRGPCRELARTLRADGVDVRFSEYNGGHDYACWRGAIADGLRVLLNRGNAGDRLVRTDEDGG